MYHRRPSEETGNLGKGRDPRRFPKRLGQKQNTVSGIKKGTAIKPLQKKNNRKEKGEVSLWAN